MPFPIAIGSTASPSPSDRLPSSDLLGELIIGSRGGLAATSPHSPTGAGPLLEMLFIPNGAVICGGLIGSQQLICAEETCVIQSHKSRRCEVRDGSLYIVAPSSQGRRTSALYSEPFASDVSVSEDMLAWLVRPKTLELHRRALTILSGMTSAEQEAVDVDEFAECVGRQGVVGRTPAPKKRGLGDMFDSLDADAVFLSDQMTMSPVLEARFDGGADEFLEENWPKIQSALGNLSKTVEKFSQVSEVGLPDLGIQINELDAALLSLKGTVGAWDGSRSCAGYGATLFSIVDGLSEAVQELQLSQKLLRGAQSDPKLSVKLESVVRAVQGLSSLVNDPSTGVASLGGAMKDLALWSQRVDMRLMGLEMGGLGGDPMEVQPAAVPERSEGVSHDTYLELERRVDLLEELSTVDTGVFEINDIVLNRVEDAFDWLVKQGPAGAVSSGWLDIFSLADFAGLGTSFKEQLADRKRVCDSKIQVEGSEILVLASFGPEYPSVFGDSSSATDTQPLPKATTYREWYNSDESSECVYQQWSKASENYKKQIFSAELKTQAWRGSAAASLVSLAEQLQLRTTQFLVGLQASVTTFYDKMVNDDGTPPEEAWLLVSRMLQAIFRKLADARSVAGRPLNNPFATLDDRMRRSARVLWGTFECHRLMHEIRSIGFNKHPVIIPAQTLALYSMKAGKAEVDRLNKLMKLSEDSIRPLTASEGRVSQSKVNSIETSVTTLKTENKFLKESLKKLENRLKTLENK